MSKSIRTEIIIGAPKEKVWSVLTNFEEYGKWNPFIVSIKGNLKIGSRLENIMLNNGKKFVFKPVVLSVIPNQYYSWLGSLIVKGIFDGHHYFEIEEIGPNKVKLSQGENFSGLLCNLILKKIGAETRNNFIKMNNAVKTLAEQKS